MAGFAGQVQGETESAFSKAGAAAAKAFGIAFGAYEAGKFVVEITKHAGEVQKATEAIAAEFGKAGEAVTAFAEKGAEKLGISAHEADQTAARFGLLFQNLGVGQEAAAKMTVGFEQLAGAVGLIRGIKPGVFLQNLPLAAAGNLRSLKQLGLGIDQATLKTVAFTHGLTATITSGLTPATRAQAIYIAATARLPQLLQQAAAHSHDLITQQIILAAEWDNAKDKLGAGLLPLMAKLTYFLADKLPGAIQAVVAGFSDLSRTISDVVGFLKPVFDPIIEKFNQFKTAFQFGGLDAVKRQFQSMSAEAKIATVAVGALAVAFGVSVLAAAPIFSAVAAFVAIGVAAQEAYKHSYQFQNAVTGVKDFIDGQLVPALKHLNAELGPGFKAAADVAGTALTSLGDAISAVTSGFRSGGFSQAKQNFIGLGDGAKAAAVGVGILAVAFAGLAISAAPFTAAIIGIAALGAASVIAYQKSERFRGAIDAVAGTLKNFGLKLGPDIRKAGQAAAAAFEALATVIKTTVGAALKATLYIWQHWGDTIKSVVSTSFGAVIKVVGDDLQALKDSFKAVTDIFTGKWSDAWHHLADIPKQALDSVITGVKAFGTNLETVFKAIWQKIELDVIGAAVAITKIVAKIPTQINIFGHTFGVENPAKKALEALNSLSANIRTDRARAAGEKWAAGITKGIADALAKARKIQSDALEAAQRAQSGPDSRAAYVAGHNIGVSFGKGAADGVAQTPAQLRSAIVSAKQALQQAGAADQAAISKMRQGLTDLRSKLTTETTQMVTDVRQAVEDAKSNLITIGQSLAQSVGDVMQKPFDNASQAIQDASDRLTLRFDIATRGFAQQQRVLQLAQDRLTAQFDREGQGLAKQQRQLGVEQAKQGLAADKQQLESLRKSIILPGGKTLSTDPQKALAELKALQAKVGGGPETVIANLITKYEGMVLQLKSDNVSLKQQIQSNAQAAGEGRIRLQGEGLQVKQDVTANAKAAADARLQLQQERLRVAQDRLDRLKEAAQTEINDLTAGLAKGSITVGQFSKKLAELLKKDHVTFKKAGALLGSAFQDGFEAQLKGITKQALALSAARRGGVNVGDTTGQEPKIVDPLKTLHKDQLAIHKTTEQIGNKQVALQLRIAKAAEKQAALQQKLSAALTAGGKKTPAAKNAGKQTKVTKDLHATTG